VILLLLLVVQATRDDDAYADAITASHSRREYEPHTAYPAVFDACIQET